MSSPADLDGDGDPDLVLANRDGGANAIQWNDGGGFERVSGYGTGSDETRGVAVGDVDGDGVLDIVTANIGESNGVYFGDGSGGFERSLPFGRDDDESYAVHLADLDLDGDPDIVVANVGARNAVYFNRGGEFNQGGEPRALREFRFWVRGLLNLRAGCGRSERRRVSGYRYGQLRGAERPLRERAGWTGLEGLLSRQRRRLPDPAHQEILVRLVILVDVEVAHVLVL